MSLRNYKPKTKPAIWQNAFPPQADTRAAARRRDIRKYRARVEEWKRGKVCASCGGINLQCHHKHGRGHRGELLLIEELWIPLCARCHDRVHRNKAEARAKNLFAPLGEWNKMPKHAF